MDFYQKMGIVCNEIPLGKVATYFEIPDMQKMLLQDEDVEVTWNGKYWVVDLRKYGWKNTMEDAYVLQEKFGEIVEGE